ncbi:hypothetical protein [Desulforamulus ruminis]|uniref:hypothetical protein n=1 Tax=Desulforamulus ruminis TaxID=1564 RepID=UPI002354169F|nr:hypothetical protein [Desulforamulus ruminis]
MPTTTSILGLKKPLGNETVTRQAYNENLDLIDQNVATKTDLAAHLTEFQQLKDFLNYMPINGGDFDGNEPTGLTVDGGVY